MGIGFVWYVCWLWCGCDWVEHCSQCMCHVSSVSIVHRGLMEVRRGEYSIYYGLELGSKRVSSWRGVVSTKGNNSKVNGS